ncbi:MAG: lipoate--protein ligase [Emergencia timonensis]|uniref:lipoate--protein ligase n=1 Tax=Emergencia timonensis TaxID=1776384 RepID=UPI000830DBA2|nr:lipoate--protein ligase [Emergencia timonensis]WNX88134.1 lipoate--protein ligase [Emergencia timonensis]
MKYIESNSTNPYFNLALEEYLFDSVPTDESCFMLWQNTNTIVIGKYQNAIEEINQAYVDENKISVVRRLSGGGAVYHDAGNLNLTFIVDAKEVSDFNFKVFVIPIIHALKKFGVQAAFNGRNDMTIDGKKFSGNAQYVKKGKVLHHGCIMLDSNLTDVSDALKVKAAKFISKNAKSVRSRVTTINAGAPYPITMDEFKEALKEEILGTDSAKPYVLTEEDLTKIKRIQREKYETWNWNYGRAAAYSMVREEKFPAGLVTVHMNAKDGCIGEIKFYGDFFGNGEIEELEEGLRGAALDQNLTRKLEALQSSYYMNGITAEELSRLIRG